jgi:Uma2 family endonuclease
MSVQVEESSILEDQELEEVASLEHGAIVTQLLLLVASYAQPNQLGQVFAPQTSFKFKGKTQFRREPDLTFVVTARLPTNFRVEADFAPDLAAEVISKNDKDFEIETKVKQYQKSGVRLVWLIRPLSQTISVYRLETELVPQVLGPQHELSGEEIIPGFKLKVSELFANIPVINDDEEFE